MANWQQWLMVQFSVLIYSGLCKISPIFQLNVTVVFFVALSLNNLGFGDK